MKLPRPRAVAIASSVGGGPMARLARALTDGPAAARAAARAGLRPWAAHVLEGQSPERYRARMAAGRLGRLAARLDAFARFPAQVLVRALHTPADGAATSEAEVLVPTTNPFFLPWLLIATRPLHGRAVVPLLYDLYPDALEAAGLARPTSLPSRLAAAANRWSLARADGVVFIGRRMADQVRARYGEPTRWTVIETGADVAELRVDGDPATDPAVEPAETDLERWCDEHVVVSYVGALGHMHDWDTLALAVPRLLALAARQHASRARGRRRRPPLGVVFAATGPGVDALRQAWAHLPPDHAAHLRLVPPLSDRAWARLLRRSSLSLATLRPAAHRTSMPSKAQSAIAAGAALVAVAPADSDLGELVDEHHVGVRVDPGDAQGLVDAITHLTGDGRRLAAARRRAAAVAAMRYDMPKLALRWRAFLTQVLASRSAARPPSRAQRAVDLLGAGVGLGLTGPVMLGAAAAVRLTMGSPVLFRQPRPGYRGEVFQLAKFRTMRPPRPGEEGPEADAARLTPVGRFLRATSLDELPTLLSVLRGEMSLVGPRPLLVRYLDRYSAEQARRHDVRPGVTGWAQVNGRNSLSWNEKFALDTWYVDNRTLWRDAWILLLTVAKVFRREGISQEGHATMPEFMGPEFMGPEFMGPEFMGPESTGPESVGPESSGASPPQSPGSAPAPLHAAVQADSQADSQPEQEADDGR